MRNATLLRRFAAAVSFVLAAGTARQVLAQGSGGPTPTPVAPDPTAVPLDGGASILLAGSVAYGLRKLRQRRK
jgi:hypothetical protein